MPWVAKSSRSDRVRAMNSRKTRADLRLVRLQLLVARPASACRCSPRSSADTVAVRAVPRKKPISPTTVRVDMRRTTSSSPGSDATDTAIRPVDDKIDRVGGRALHRRARCRPRHRGARNIARADAPLSRLPISAASQPSSPSAAIRRDHRPCLRSAPRSRTTRAPRCASRSWR